LDKAKAETSKPSFIALSTIIGWPSPTKQDTGAIHGSKLGDEEVAALKKELGFDPDKSFEVEPEILTHMHQVKERGIAAHSAWNAEFAKWQDENRERAALLKRTQAGDLPDGWHEALPEFSSDNALATRAASGEVLSALAPVLPELWGGSADLAGSNNTTMKGEPSFLPEKRSTEMFKGNLYGRTLHFGIREHAMGAILNGITLHGPTRAYGGTFLTFSDYMRPAVRLASLMKVPSIFVWTHDSIGLGEDGPTHQPIEHLAALRAIPGLSVVRPADANETAWAWRGILEDLSGPAGLVLTRQGVPTVERGDSAFASAEGVLKGAYVLSDSDGEPDVILIGTGSEVQYAVGAQEVLKSEGINARVVSMPCREWFERQDDAYRESVLPHGVKARVSVEAGIAQGWRDIVGDAGRIVSIEHYGASADGALLFEKFGFTSENVAAAARDSLEASN
ncbi:MAG: transketolase C-terminal domain-containing protein, partial [Demequina sp.]